MSDKRIHTGRWTKLSKEILFRDNYECGSAGCERTATTVDHIKPSSKYPELFWDHDNLIAMCEYHNFSKQDKEVNDLRLTWFSTDWFTEDYIKEQMQ